MFNGTTFTQRPGAGFTAQPVPWESEASFRLPVAVYRDAMDRNFPNSAWLRLRQDSFDALHLFRIRRGLPSWESAIEALLDAAGEKDPS
jgi:hypothetical protein